MKYSLGFPFARVVAGAFVCLFLFLCLFLFPVAFGSGGGVAADCCGSGGGVAADCCGRGGGVA